MNPPSRRQRATVLLSALGSTILLGSLTAPPANAHNVLIDSSPEDGATVDSVPEEVELVFNEEVLEGGNAIAVLGPDDDTDYAAGADIRLDGASAAVDLAPLTEAGDYTVDYRIISADGHPIEEQISFTVSEEAAADANAAAAEEEPQDEADADREAQQDEDAGQDADGAANPLSQNTWLGAAAALAGVGFLVALIVLVLRRTGSGGSGGPNSQG